MDIRYKSDFHKFLSEECSGNLCEIGLDGVQKHFKGMIYAVTNTADSVLVNTHSQWPNLYDLEMACIPIEKISFIAVITKLTNDI